MQHDFAGQLFHRPLNQRQSDIGEYFLFESFLTQADVRAPLSGWHAGQAADQHQGQCACDAAFQFPHLF